MISTHPRCRNKGFLDSLDNGIYPGGGDIIEGNEPLKTVGEAASERIFSWKTISLSSQKFHRRSAPGHIVWCYSEEESADKVQETYINSERWINWGAGKKSTSNKLDRCFGAIRGP